jgi:hypothetical protein
MLQGFTRPQLHTAVDSDLPGCTSMSKTLMGVAKRVEIFIGMRQVRVVEQDEMRRLLL